MGFWVVMGALAGAVLGVLGDGIIAAGIGAIVGAGLGALVGRASAASGKSSAAGNANGAAAPPRPASGDTPPPRPAYGERSSSPPSIVPPVSEPLRVAPSASGDANRVADPMSLVLARIDAIDRRLAFIEARLGVPLRAAQAVDAPPPAIETPPFERDESAQPPTEVPPHAEAEAGLDEAAPSTSEPPPRPDYATAGEVSPGATRAPSFVWRWLTGGNAMTRVGIVVLFFGVAFLLRYFAEIVTVPIYVKLAGAGAGGLLLAAIGVVLARKRPAYGLSLQGAGMGIVYLTVFAAFRLYEVISPAPAIALLVVVSATAIALALRHDSQPLAALALAGGFLAPVLIRTGAANAALLLGYFAVLNAVIFALAWKRAWRGLNVLGFVFTFALALVWGHRFYTPSHYAIVQPYLALFFGFYLTIAILYARRGALSTGAPVDGVLVFGVPIVGFALQMAIVRGHRYGVAWSAGLLAVLYGALWLAVRRSTTGGLALLAKAFALLAVIFATLVIPFTVDPRATAAWWALEGAAVYWLGVMQRQGLMRAFALVLQVLAAGVFLSDYMPGEGRLLLNANLLGMVLIGVAAFGSAWVADRHAEHVSDRERAMVPALILWGTAWWIVGGVDDLRRHLPSPARIDAALAWVVVSSAAALALSRVLGWPRIAWLSAALFPAMLVAGFDDVRATRTTLTHYGWLVWPLAWVVLWAALRFAERVRGTAPANQPTRDDMFRVAHAMCAIALVAWTSWELSEWASRRTAIDAVWIACAAALPAIAYLYATVLFRDSQRWPVADHAAAYGSTAGTTIAAFLFAWLVIVNLTSPGDPAPLPYLPLLNPLDLTLIAAIATLAAWDGAWGRHPPPIRYAWLGAAAFIALNGAVVRTAHHWGDVSWQFDALLAYRPAQAALTLTWTVTALALMLYATRRSVRALWMVGAALLAVVVIKLFAVDLAALSGLTRVVAFIGVGLLLLVIGYVAPLPPTIPTPVDGQPAQS